ncbi:hypothetical protein PROFUN_03877 [Planoprotostelium fungivorum]|uniref:Glycosyl hydrolase family 95 N-terminal domain-containing protein n=1 Tax=Planoprotostelium fungivorum TaxID=1890364 RepID=A0A2P6MTK4_9EUKA|nr:hypothetical protein PROFUN_03877 [Planoprotostelium fungivorum]
MARFFEEERTAQTVYNISGFANLQSSGWRSPFCWGMDSCGVEEERVVLNEHTVWSGGPFDNPQYTGNNDSPSSAGKHKETIEMVRRYIDNNLSVPEE